MPVTKGSRRTVLGQSRALPFCLSLWLASTFIDVRVLDLMLGSALAIGSPEFDMPTIGIS
jgi:hypothetical protein